MAILHDALLLGFFCERLRYGWTMERAVARIGLRDMRGKGIRVASPKSVDLVLILITTYKIVGL